MAEDSGSDQEKTEEPSPRKLDEAKRKGQVAKSKEFPAAMTMVATLFFAYSLGKEFFFQIGRMFSYIFGHSGQKEMNLFTIGDLLDMAMAGLLPIIFGLFALLAVAAIFGNLSVVGLIFSTENLKIDFSKIKPLEKFQQIFASKDSLMELVKGITKITLFMLLSVSVISAYMPQIMAMGKLSNVGSIVLFGRIFLELLMKTVLFYVVLGVADWAYQKYSFRQKMRMSKQELKEEYKNQEGDPMIKSQRRQKARELLAQNTEQAVQGADVVITNPTHYAVVLKYDQNSMYAPVVVAKGVDFMAQQIKKIAKKNDVTIYEAPPLARFLHATVEVGQEIPEDVYKAVAEILMHVYKMKGKVNN